LIAQAYSPKHEHNATDRGPEGTQPSLSTEGWFKTRMSDGLSKREQAVLVHLSNGLSNKEIALVLDISPRTVQKHLQNIYRHFDIRAREHLKAIRNQGKRRSS
jgi:DNA-binding NarL/FixJ family response regulator